MESKNYYDKFVRQGLAIGFTDDQIEFIWDWILEAILNPEAFTHNDNYKKDE